MGLTLQQSTTPIIYRLCEPGDELSIYNPQFCIAPRIYREQFNATLGVAAFYYDANADKYRLLSQLDFAIWPSWTINFYQIDPITGLQDGATFDGSSSGLAWTKSHEAGAFNKVYAHRTVDGTIVEVDNTLGVPNASQLANPVLTVADIGGNAPTAFVLNRANSIIAFNGSGQMQRWNFTTMTQLTSIAMPYLTIVDSAYESDELAWVLQRSNDLTKLAIVKVNYKNATVEGYSILDESLDDIALGPDVNAGIAYDSLRKTVAVFRQKSPGVDGGARHKLDLYKPIAKPTILTAPTPLKKVVKDVTVPMLAHLVGQVGEGGAGRQVEITNSGSGKILQSMVGVKTNGSIPFLYEAPSTLGTDTITLETTV